MLGRAKFDLSTVETEIKRDTAECQSILKGKEILFSPYQTLEYSVVNQAMKFSLDVQKVSNIESRKKIATAYQQKIGGTLSSLKISVDQSAKYNNKYVTRGVQVFAAHVQELYKKYKSIDRLVEYIVEEHVNDKKTEFYPLVETLFRIIGVDCHK